MPGRTEAVQKRLEAFARCHKDRSPSACDILPGVERRAEGTIQLNGVAEGQRRTYATGPAGGSTSRAGHRVNGSRHCSHRGYQINEATFWWCEGRAPPERGDTGGLWVFGKWQWHVLRLRGRPTHHARGS
jgi:hypothetical protein